LAVCHSEILNFDIHEFVPIHSNNKINNIDQEFIISETLKEMKKETNYELIKREIKKQVAHHYKYKNYKIDYAQIRPLYDAQLRMRNSKLDEELNDD
jgi:hypothetical protein